MQHRHIDSRTARTALTIAALLITAATLTGCRTLSNASFYWNLWRASRAGDRFYENHEPGVRDLAFTSVSDVRLDVYSPDEEGSYPVLVFVHGGGWNKYDKKLFAPVAMKLVPRDLVVVIPDYTLHPDAGYRQMSREVAAAVAWTLDHVDEYGGDPNRIVLSGHSAGGHLSGLVAFDESWLAEQGHSPGELCGWVGLSGVHDIDAQMAFERETGGTAPVMTAVMGGEDNFPAASPISYVGADRAAPRSDARAPADVPRAWLIHGDRDSTVPVGISRSMADRLRAADIPVDLLIYPESGHSDFLFEALSDDKARVLEDLVSATSACPR